MLGKRLSAREALGVRELDGLKTWIEVSSRNFLSNYRFFRSRIGPKVKLWAVVKSNAYGHGLFVFSKLAAQAHIDGFCADSFIEGIKLRREGIKQPILILGPTTLPFRTKALNEDITITVSNFEALHSLARIKDPPAFHIKIDSGMNRQGFQIETTRRVGNFLKRHPALQNRVTGIYTHFASAKDVNYPTYTEMQFKKFLEAVHIIKKETRIRHRIVEHCAATGATLVDKKYHLDAVRVGIGLYGLWPSLELELQRHDSRIQPILSWKTVISEIKNVSMGEFVGYDLSERTTRKTKIAILPIGYWHGFPRALSSIGSVLIRGKRARVLGKVSMDLVVVDVTGIPCASGDRVTLIGRDGKNEIQASHIARQSGTVHYEFLTRLNPLMERICI